MRFFPLPWVLSPEIFRFPQNIPLQGFHHSSRQGRWRFGCAAARAATPEVTTATDNPNALSSFGHGADHRFAHVPCLSKIDSGTCSRCRLISFLMGDDSPWKTSGRRLRSPFPGAMSPPVQGFRSFPGTRLISRRTGPAMTHHVSVAGGGDGFVAEHTFSKAACTCRGSPDSCV